jgi:hypothetical protein
MASAEQDAMPVERRRPARRRRWRWSAIGLIAVCVLLATRIEVINPRVHVRWQAGIGNDQRRFLERRYDLRDGSEIDPPTSTWQYRLGTLSQSNIRALVENDWVDDTEYIDRRAMTSTGREFRLLWYPYADLFDEPSELLQLHQSVWLLLAGSAVLGAARASTSALRRNVTVAALLSVGVMAVAVPFRPSFVTMGGSEGRAKSRADFEFFFADRVRFEKHLSQVLMLEWYQLDGSDAAPERALVAMGRFATGWFLVSALAIAWAERWSSVVLRYISLGLLAPTALLYFGWREFGYVSLSMAAFPLIARGLREDGMRLEAGSAFAGFGAALHGSGLVSLAGGALAAFTAVGTLHERLLRVLRLAAWGTAAYLGWIAVYVIVLRLPIAPDPGPAAFSSWRPLLINEVRGGRISAALWSATTARDLAMSAWIVGAPLFLVAGSLWRRHAPEVRAALWYAVPSVLFLTLRWPYDGVGGGIDLIAAGFPALYALVWICAHDAKRTYVAAALLISAHYAFWRVVIDKSFVP